ncbi:exonuclease domain-containing protein [Corynebacterium choanae]|nr:exonuclease domain-containing protein [Corynebacterium choanae]
MFGLSAKARAARAATGALAEFYRTAPVDKRAPLHSLPLLAVDVETTGLSPKTDRLLSIGWVAVNGASIDAGSAYHAIVQQPDHAPSVGQSATVHGVTDDMLAGGVPLGQVLDDLLVALRGRVMLCHYAAMEQQFLSSATQQLYHASLHVPIVDTFALERRHMERMGTYPRGEDLRLPRVRRRYGLPAYHNHHATTDALACAELYLAQCANSTWSTLQHVQP